MAIELEFWEWVIAGICAIGFGISKAGIKGLGVFLVAVFALLFGSKLSTGIVLVLFSIGDILAITYYRKEVNWRIFWKIIPWMIFGVLIGTYVGKDVPEIVFKYGMAAIIFISVLLMIWWEFSDRKVVPHHWTFAGGMGTVAGITTMAGNLAGSFVNIFFLALRIPKMAFIGTAAWIFFFINLFKMPFHIWSWGTINLESLKVNLYLFLPLIIGFFIGVRLVDKINESNFRKLILILTALGAILIAIK